MENFERRPDWTLMGKRQAHGKSGTRLTLVAVLRGALVSRRHPREELGLTLDRAGQSLADYSEHGKTDFSMSARDQLGEQQDNCFKRTWNMVKCMR